MLECCRLREWAPQRVYVDILFMLRILFLSDNFSLLLHSHITKSCQQRRGKDENICNSERQWNFLLDICGEWAGVWLLEGGDEETRGCVFIFRRILKKIFFHLFKNFWMDFLFFFSHKYYFKFRRFEMCHARWIYR
jgi:hypothetical protein